MNTWTSKPSQTQTSSIFKNRILEKIVRHFKEIMYTIEILFWSKYIYILAISIPIYTLNKIYVSSDEYLNFRANVRWKLHWYLSNEFSRNDIECQERHMEWENTLSPRGSGRPTFWNRSQPCSWMLMTGDECFDRVLRVE